MAKSKVVSPNPAKEERQKTAAREQRDRLQRKLDEKIEDRNFWLQTVQDRRFAEFMADVRRDIDENKETLVSCDKNDVDKHQATVNALRAFVRRVVQKTSDVSIEEAKKALKLFEEENALFLYDEKEEDSKDSAKAE